MDLSDREILLFELCEILQMPLYELLHNMPYDEFLGWLAYFKVRPIGWREDYRTYLLIKAQTGLKASPETIFPSLAPIFARQSKVKEELAASGKLSMDNLRKSAFFQKLNNATGGTNIFQDMK